MVDKEPESKEEYDVNKFERPSVTTDVVIFTIKNDDLKVLLIKRGVWPFKDMWALPGGFVGMKESLDDAAKRELCEETGVCNVYLEQLYTFGEPKRDPRTRVITVAYMAVTNQSNIKLRASSDATEVDWYSVYNLPKLGFDHAKIIDYALTRLRYKLEYKPVAFEFLPPKFTLTELQKVYEIVYNKTIDKRNFRKKVNELNVLKDMNETKMEGAHRPAKLYSFIKENFKSVENKWIVFVPF
ncbi:NUDIX domain-containing protein [Nanoarchaeota archaeon]